MTDATTAAPAAPTPPASTSAPAAAPPAGQAPPSATETTATPPADTTTTTTTTQTETSASAEVAQTGAETPPDPLTLKPDAADGYGFTVSDKARSALGDISNDPAVKEAQAYAFEQGWTRGEFDKNVGGLVNHLVEKGLFEPTFDPAAETAALGEHGATRQRELQTFLDSVKTRGEIDDAQYGELSRLVPTAAGTRALEWLKGQMRGGGLDTGGDGAAVEDGKAKAMEMAQDPRYRSDRVFRAEADAAWVAAFGGRTGSR
jgi:hypothetical protein